MNARRSIAALAAAAAFAAAVPARADTLAPAPPGPDATAPRLVAPEPGFRPAPDSIRFEAEETSRCLVCHGLPDFVVRADSSGAWRSLFVEAASFRRSAHGRIACTSCHADVRAFPHDFAAPRPRVGCDADCHARDAAGRALRHDAAARDAALGAHGAGPSTACPDCPACADCHDGDPHAVSRTARADAAGPHAPPDAAEAACLDCHERLDRERGRGADSTFAAAFTRSFHARARALGAAHAAACGDCHGAHRAAAASDTASTVAPARLAATCGQRECHERAGATFAAAGLAHGNPLRSGAPPFGPLARVFGACAIAIAALLALLVLADAQRRFAPPAPRRLRDDSRLIARTLPAERLQHAAFAASFLALALTGIAIRHPEAAARLGLAAPAGGLEPLRLAHRAAALALLAAALAHAGYLAALLSRGGFSARRAWGLLPGRDDVRELRESLRYAFRRRPDAPAAGRHGFRARLHYAAVALGVPVMAASGLVLWTRASEGTPFPAAALAVARAIHGEEALLALVVFAVWHLYAVLAVPWPHERLATFLDGRITVGEWRALHGLEAPEPGGSRAPLPAVEVRTGTD